MLGCGCIQMKSNLVLFIFDSVQLGICVVGLGLRVVGVMCGCVRLGL